MSQTPAISVIIPTYNWSAALRLAIRSVLLQTMQDFEILVVGDGCTDDSEQVVRDFRDPRISWHNLARNYGSQWAADNYGMEAARASFIAYLGHDDIWYPTHLAAILRAARDANADVVTSIMALYGPPGSGVYGVAGLFPTGVYTARDFVPPSAFAHSRQLGLLHRWQDPAELDTPVDMFFINNAIAVATTVASTRELTCFKFNAAWRRDSYKIKSVTEQEQMLARVESGVDFRPAELLNVVEAAVADRMIKIRAAKPSGVKGVIVERNRKYKGAQSRFSEAELVTVSRPLRFDMRNQDMLLEWHDLQHVGKDRLLRATGLHHLWGRKTYRWTGHTSTDAAAWRDPSEVEAWKAKCPIRRLGALLGERGMSATELSAITAAAKSEMQTGRAAAKEAPWPQAAAAYADVQDTGAVAWHR